MKLRGTLSQWERRIASLSLGLICPLVALWVWCSSLAFVPVPWPDDSAFYFVARELFRWPPRWVMLPQAPFEPSYRIFNFNTMPLYPVLIGLGRLIGIDGSFALKIWPLSFWAASGSLFAVSLYRAGLPGVLTAILAFALALDPTLRWASVLVRPESLIGLCGMAIVLGISLGPFRKKPRRWYWDPVAALLCVAAYAHFNAIHLVFAVVAAFALRPRRLLAIGGKCALYLSPWIGVVLLKWSLFQRQMATQWQRLAVHNGWLDSLSSAVNSLFQSLGSPEPWPRPLYLTAYGLWALIFLAVAYGIFYPLADAGLAWFERGRRLTPEVYAAWESPTVAPAGWVIGAIWLWNSKPEVWFIYYLHLAIWSWVGLAAWQLWTRPAAERRITVRATLAALGTLVAAMACIFAYVDTRQAQELGDSRSWHWSTYHSFVDCLDHTLTRYQHALGDPRSLRVWAPTFPDVTIELSRRHPDWELTRTNDFAARNYLAIRHAHDVDAVVVTETLNWRERDLDGPLSMHPDASSVWMNWRGYYLNQLWREPGWKPERHICQTGRWQGFIFMEAVNPSGSASSRIGAQSSGAISRYRSSK